MWKPWFRVDETIVFTVGGIPQRPQKPSKKRFEKIYRNNIEKTQKKPKIVKKGTPRGGQKAVNEPTFSSKSRVLCAQNGNLATSQKKQKQNLKNDHSVSTECLFSDSREDPRTNFFVTFSTRPLWGSPGWAQGPQNTSTDTKMTPTYDKNETNWFATSLS